MRILKYESEQYAGVRNQDVTFTEGMNVVLGDNEIGKSTMIVGIYETLLRSSQIKMSSTVGKVMKKQSFPTGGGNSIDGSVRLAVGEEEFIIKKEWDIKNERKNGKDQEVIDSDITFIDSSDRKYKGTEAEKKISQLLNYGEAIYNHIVFGRQNNESAILDWFYSFVDTEKIQGDGIAEARKKISEAFSATGGISEDLYLQKIREKIEALEDHWNLSLNAPKDGRGIDHPWDKKVTGEILEAYYAWEKQKKAWKDEKKLMDSIAVDESNLQEKRDRKLVLEGQLQELNQSKSSIEIKALQSGNKDTCEQNLRRFRDAERKWPELEADKKNIETLSAEKDEQEKREQKWKLEEDVRKIYDLERQKKAVQKDMDGMEEIEEDNRTCQGLLVQIEGIQLKLGSAKLHAQITMLSDHVAQMSTSDKETIQINKQYDAPVNGFANIQIPGIAKIMIAPQELDVAGLQEQIKDKQDDIQKIFDKYEVENKDGLNQKCETYQKNKSRRSELDDEIRKLLNGKSIEELETELDGIWLNEMISIRENLLDDVQTVFSKYKAQSLDVCRKAVQVQIDTYEKDYESVSKLKEMIADEEEKLRNAKEELRKLESVTWTKEDFDKKQEEIQKELNGSDGKSGLNKEIEALNFDIGRKNKDIEDIDLDAREQEVKSLEEKFEQKKKLYRQYSRIKTDFESLKEKQGSKNDVFYDRFNQYLSIITKNQVQIENGKIRSNKNELNSKELLSRGTKQTILLAFRLALLEYYYPDDGGVIILDDVLLDMDPERRKQSVELLQKFAEKNQVIFTTCDPAIADMLGGNRIELEKSKMR